MRINYYLFFCLIFNCILSFNDTIIDEKLVNLDNILTLCNVPNNKSSENNQISEFSQVSSNNEIDSTKEAIDKQNSLYHKEYYPTPLNIDSRLEKKDDKIKNQYYKKEKNSKLKKKNNCNKRVKGINRTDHRSFSNS